MKNMNEDWWVFRGNKCITEIPPPPPWRFGDKKFSQAESAVIKKPNKGDSNYIIGKKEIEIINAAIYLRRPLLVTGKPGTGKTALANAIASELGLGGVLTWPITTQSTLKDGLYQYDAIARLQDVNVMQNDKSGEKSHDAIDMENYLRLGPLGTSFVQTDFPRVLLIDEIDKSDIDLPNNLLHIFEEGVFDIPELARLKEEEQSVYLYGEDKKASVLRGKIQCTHFPIVVMTSNAEREFPPAFMRRCITLDIDLPNEDKLNRILASHFGELEGKQKEAVDNLVAQFLGERDSNYSELATDQLLNVAYLILEGIDVKPIDDDKKQLREILWASLERKN